MEKKRTTTVQSIRFTGRRKIDWKDIEIYLRQYIGVKVVVKETGDLICIGSDFPDEFCGSKDTARLKGTQAKAKANASQIVCELIECGQNKRYKHNLADKHKKEAKYGWYRYDSYFQLPVYDTNNTIERYNVFKIEILIRHAEDGMLYLYDMVNIKKETGTPLEQ